MHLREAKGILSARNGMNLYRGCSHGCIYCDSRSTCYHMDHDFEDIEVKSNAIELLDRALSSKRSKCMIGTGSMSDPYMHIERDLCMTRAALECADRHGFGFSLITKSDLVVRDIDVLTSINEKAKAVVQMTVTTFDDDLCRILEPNVCVTSTRIEALRKLNEAGIPTVVWLCPILPFINDTDLNIKSIVDACADAGVKGIIWFGAGVTLREGDREYFYSKLDEHFPGLKQRYIDTFGNRYGIVSTKGRDLDMLFHSLCERHGLIHDNDELFGYINTLDVKEKTRQTDLFSF